MLKSIIRYFSVAVLLTGLYAQNDLNSTNEKKETKKYEEIKKEGYITLTDFDEWLMVTDQKEMFVEAYNTSRSHPLVQKLKCMYELNSLYNGEMDFDDLESKCIGQK